MIHMHRGGSDTGPSLENTMQMAAVGGREGGGDRIWASAETLLINISLGSESPFQLTLSGYHGR